MAQAVQVPPQQVGRAAQRGAAIADAAAGAPAAPLGRAARDPAVRARRSPWARLVIHAALLAGSLFAVLPFYWMLVTSFKTNSEAIAVPPTFIPQEWHPENYAIALAAAPFGRYFLNTAVVAC